LGRLQTLSGREEVRILAAHGLSEVRQRGSHIVMQKRSGDTTITAVVPDHKELRVGTLSSIIRQAQLPRELFEA
jgi:predicted RNA binding protein YcfA (HicA-like mRNA interferase family)